MELQISQVFMMTKPVDMRYLNNQTFFNEKQWIDILEKSNFEIVDIVPDDSDMLSVLAPLVVAMQLVYGTVPAKKWWRWFSAKNMWCDFALEDDNDNMTKIVRKNKKTIVDIESIKKYVKDMGINVAPKTLHWKRKNCKGKYANYSYFIPRNVKLPFIVSRYEPRQKSLETVHQNGAKKIAYIKIEVGKQEYKELFKLVKDDDRIQLIKGRDTHICEIGIEGLSNSIKICNVLIKAVEV